MVSFGRTNSPLGMVILRMPSSCRALVRAVILRDDFLSSVGVSRWHEDADFEDIR